jgi:uncharacterized protein (DUF2235 family)
MIGAGLQPAGAVVKRLAIFADGTWNVRDQLDKQGKRRPTNVTKLARAVLARDAAGTDQIVGYSEGVGTAGGIDRFTGGAFGRGLERNVRDLYRFILYNYVPGDEIFLFGFSRGAFTVRSLAGFMHQVGLLRKDEDYFLPEIYSVYESRNSPGSEQWKRAFRKIRNPQPSPPIRMIGCWDTVGALGAPGLLGRLFHPGKYRYHQIGLTPEVRFAYHALAIDEKRAPFRPDLWELPPGWNGTLLQAWFPGAHSNVGGGYDPDGLANEALHWVAEQAEVLGLALDQKYLDPFRPCFNSVLNDSMTPKFKLLGTHVRPVAAGTRTNEVVHQAALDRHNHASSRYAPSNLLDCLKSGRAKSTDSMRVKRGEPC